MNKKGYGELVFGVHPVTELLKAKRRKIISLYTTKPAPKSLDSIGRLISERTFPFKYVDRTVLTKIAGTPDHQNIVAWAQPFPFRKKFFDPARQKNLLMLDGVQDVRNVGALLRSAYCVGIDGVIISKKRGMPITAAALKASAGLAEHLEIYIASSSQAAMKELQAAQYTTYLATLTGEDATTISYRSPLCLVIGSEDRGISPGLYRYGIQLTLPQRAADISYNASVAGGILLFLIMHSQTRL